MVDAASYAGNWQEQMDEIIALRSILGSDFRLSEWEGGPKLQEDSDFTELLDCSVPAQPIDVHCRITVRVEMPSDGMTLSLLSPSGSQSSTTETEEQLSKVLYVPPLCLTLDLVPGYPSDAPPGFRLSAFWLSRQQLTQLARQLDQIWQEASGFPVCFTWIDWLQRSLLSTLHIETHFLIDVSPHSWQENNDPRIAVCSDEISPLKIMQDILQHDMIRSNEAFQKSAWSCPVCMEEQPGKNFVRFHTCRHFCCRECFRKYCSVNIEQGRVELRCPEVKCTTPVPPEVLKKHLEKEEYDRWEQLLLQRTLEAMSDIQYCPRCSTACIVESDHFAQCPKCYYAFCTECLDAWHPGGECIRLEKKLLDAVEKAEVGETPKQERQRYLRDLKNQVLTMQYVKKNTRECPNCGMGIEKDGGCNHMFCTYCNMHYCYVCGCMNITYDHFSAQGCVLFDESVISEWERMQGGPQQRQAQAERRPEEGPDPYDPEEQVWVYKRCPVCSTFQPKTDRNNLMRCYVCSNRFCFLCLAVLPKKNPQTHFGTGRCRQHS